MTSDSLASASAAPARPARKEGYGSPMAMRWDDPKLAVKSDDRRTFKHRLLQSWYREEVLGAEPGVYTPSGKPRRVLGSLLHGDDLKFRPERNFLNLDA